VHWGYFAIKMEIRDVIRMRPNEVVVIKHKIMFEKLEQYNQIKNELPEVGLHRYTKGRLYKPICQK
jgi:hypothetical protein